VRSRSRRPRREHPASESRQSAHVRDVRRPDPLATPETVRHARPAHNAHVRFVRAILSTSWGGEHLRPRRRSPPPASTPSFTARHSPRPRAAAKRTARTTRGTPLARFPVAIGPAGGIISGKSSDTPQEGPCAGLRRRSEEGRTDVKATRLSRSIARGGIDHGYRRGVQYPRHDGCRV